ncbi:ribbon-helix-helix domain-containing protein [Acetobacteraceae bacterium LMG 32668]|nr:ribbon-helix-helix domain-containing protein [Brytella acorum]
MAVRRRMNVYFESDLLKQVALLAARQKVSQSAVIEMAVRSFLTGDIAGQQEAALIRRLDHLSRQMDGLDEDLSVMGETLALYVRAWMNAQLPLPPDAQEAAKARGRERYQNFLAILLRHLATGDRFLKERSRDIAAVREQRAVDANGAGESSVG